MTGALADATPPERDRYVDFLRAASIGVVVIGHFFIAVIFWTGWAVINNVNAILLMGISPLGGA